jgi:hypothetical protein
MSKKDDPTVCGAGTWGGKTKKKQKMKSKRDGHTNGCRRDFA